MFLSRVLLPLSLIFGTPWLPAQLVHAANVEEKIRFSVAAVTASYMDEFVAIRRDVIQIDPPQSYGIVQYSRTLAVLPRHGWPRSL